MHRRVLAVLQLLLPATPRIDHRALFTLRTSSLYALSDRSLDPTHHFILKPSLFDFSFCSFLASPARAACDKLTKIIGK